VDLNLLALFLGDRPVDEIGLDDLRRYIVWLRTQRHNDPRSLRRKVASVKAFFGYLRQSGLRADDPAEALVYPGLEPHLPEFLDDAEAERLIGASAGRPLWHAMILTLLDCGLKRDEVLALHPADLSFSPPPGALTIRATDQAAKVRARNLALSDRLAAALATQLAIGAGDRVFPISVRAVNFIVEACGKAAGIRKRGAVSPQMLRDTFAVRAVRACLADEARRRQEGANDPELALLRARHDLEVCELLGLTPGGTNDPIARYREVAAPRGRVPGG
jgi:integrase